MKYSIATLASHSCLQILKGAKDEGFHTIAIAKKESSSLYKRFKFIDEIIEVSNFLEFYSFQKYLKEKNTIIIPHGSFVAYLGENYEKKLSLMHYGNKEILSWESDRLKQREWMEKSGIKVPRIFKHSKEIDRIVIVKLFGAMGGSGYFIAKNENDFNEKIKSFSSKKYIIQEYIVGAPVFLQFFYSKVHNEVELLGVDRRYESNVDGIGRVPYMLQKDIAIEPSYTVIGNFPIVIRESLLPKAYKMAEQTITVSKKLIPPKGLYGPFCLETIVTKDQEFYCIEISCRIVAGTNVYNMGSPYSEYHFNEQMSTGKRIAREIKEAIELNRLTEILN